MVWKLVRRNVAGKPFRFLLTCSAVTAGVMFVVGIFVFTDGLRATFSDLSADVEGNYDLAVRTSVDFGGDLARPPIDTSVADVVAGVDGVTMVQPRVADIGNTLVLDADGEAAVANGPPSIGVNWEADNPDLRLFLVEGREPQGPGEFVYDVDTFSDRDLEVGQTYDIVTPAGVIDDVELVGTFNFGSEDENSTVGAQIAAFELDWALEILNLGTGYDDITLSLDSGTDQTEAIRALSSAVGPGIEVITAADLQGEQTEQFEEVIGIFQTILLVFAFIILIVSAFVIFNVFSILIGQRIRELGLLRAIGATGRQVTTALIGEAFLVGVFAMVIGTALGIAFGWLLRFLLQQIDFGPEGNELVLKPATFIWGAVVGILVTMASAIAPALRARHVSPMAALRDDARLTRRLPDINLPLGVIVTVVGWALIALGISAGEVGPILSLGLIGVFANAFGMRRINHAAGRVATLVLGVVLLLVAVFADLEVIALLSLLGVAAITLFLGVNGISPALARPVSNFLGRWPLAMLLGIGGVITTLLGVAAVIGAVVLIGISLFDLVTDFDLAGVLGFFGAFIPLAIAAAVLMVGIRAVDASFIMGWTFRQVLVGVAIFLVGAVGALNVLVGLAGLLTGAWEDTIALAIGAVIFAVAWALRRFVPSAMKSNARMARENAGRSPRRTASAAAALMIGLALVSTATVVTSSFKATFAEVLESSVTSDWFISPSNQQSPTAGFSTDLAEELRALPETDGVLSYQFSLEGYRTAFDDLVRDSSATSLGPSLDHIDPDMVELDESLLGRNAIFVHEDFADDNGFAIGSEFDIDFNDGITETVVVAGIFADSSIYGNRIVDLELWADHFTTGVDQFVSVLVADGVTEDEARAAIESVTDEYSQIFVDTREEFQERSEGQIDSILTVFNVLLLVAIIIALLGIAITLALSVFERTRELGLVRAVGMTSQQMLRMVLFEGAIIAVFGGVLGVVLGAIFGSAAVVVIPDTFISTLDVPVLSLLQYLAIASIAGIAAAIVPARRAARLNVLEAISQG